MGSSKNSPSTERLPAAAAAALGPYVQPGHCLACGLSGGIDSVALLHVLVGLRQAWGFALTAVHIHHGLHPEAGAWAEFCRELCMALGIQLTVVRVQVERGSRDGLEAAARRARHAAFAATAADWVALAHHRGDQAETMLFNLVRGTGLRGAAAIQPRTGTLLRPLLHVSRADIAAYAVAEGLRWIEDHSNADLRHSRNFIRHRVLRELVSRFPGAEANLAAATRRFGEALRLLDDLALSDLAGLSGFPVPLAVLEQLSEPRARNALRFLLACHGVQVPSEERLREVLRQFQEAAPDRHPAVDFGAHRLVRVAGRIELLTSGD